MPKPRRPSVWKYADLRRQVASLPEANSTIAVPRGTGWLRHVLAFVGPGYMVAVGYMDPGNWATDLSGGAQFGYTLLFIILLSNLMAVLLQALATRLGIATERDLAQACHDSYPKPVSICLWAICELAIIACDVAEVIGTAIALQLLFKLPLIVGAVITILDAFLLLFLMNKGFRLLEAFVMTLLAVIAVCFFVQIVAAAPPIVQIVRGFLPSPEIVTHPEILFIAIGIVGATVMPHNLYLHSSIVQTRKYERSEKGKRDAIKWATLDSTIALTFALVINAAILILAAAVFHGKGHSDVGEIGQAFRLLSPLLGVGIASVLFAIALLASGINSTVTATLAGQIVMEGFLHIRVPQWVRRLITRGLAIIPVVSVTMLFGEHGTAKLLILSQVVLSLQLPFAMIPLVLFVSDKRKMGQFVTPGWMTALAWTVVLVIVGLNGELIADTLFKK